MKKNKILIWVLSITLVLIFSIGTLYITDYYRADYTAIENFSQNPSVKKTEFKGALTYSTGQENTAFIFYPGGKVEYTSYQPLMQALAEKGVFCILVKMPCNLAVLDVNAAKDFKGSYPNIDNWYIGGHSLGGSMAASHLGENHQSYKGLVLLGAYSTEDLSKTDLNVLSIYGSFDNVMNREKYEKYKPNLPKSFTEKEIKGGCHAYFGMYGKQKGDGKATISPTEQIKITADYIGKFMEIN